MTRIQLKRGQTADITFALVGANGAAFDLAGYTVTLVVAGKASALRRVATLSSPSSLGTGSFRITAADYPLLRAGVDIPFELWAVSASESKPFLSGVVFVDDVPQVTP